MELEHLPGRLGWRDATIDADILIVPEPLIEPQLRRYPAVDPPSFRRRLDELLRQRG